MSYTGVSSFVEQSNVDPRLSQVSRRKDLLASAALSARLGFPSTKTGVGFRSRRRALIFQPWSIFGLACTGR